MSLSSQTNSEDIYFDRKFQAYGKRIHPGEYKLVDNPDQMLTTILGSCVAACIRDPLLELGGMNHFLLPDEGEAKSIASDATRYGNHAMELLINDLLKLGCKRERFEVKVFGGANVSSMNVTIGDQNAEFIMDYIEQEALNLLAHDLGGSQARRIFYFPKTGKVSRFLFAGTDEINKRENEHQKSIKRSRPEIDVELFA